MSVAPYIRPSSIVVKLSVSALNILSELSWFSIQYISEAIIIIRSDHYMV